MYAGKNASKHPNNRVSPTLRAYADAFVPASLSKSPWPLSPLPSTMLCAFLRESNDALARAQLLACEAIADEAAVAAAAVSVSNGKSDVQRSRKEGSVHCPSYWRLWDLEGRAVTRAAPPPIHSEVPPFALPRQPPTDKERLGAPEEGQFDDA